MITHVYCNCNNQQPEEVKRGVYVCLNCNNDIDSADLAQDAPEPDIDDFSEAPDVVEYDAHEVESERYEAQTGERDYI